MGSETEARRTAIEQNFAAFQKLLPDLLKSHNGKFVVMREAKVDAVFDTARDAMVYGVKRFPDGLFSVQEVTDKKADLGFFSHAMSHT